MGIGQGLGARSKRRQGWGWGPIVGQFALRALRAGAFTVARGAQGEEAVLVVETVPASFVACAPVVLSPPAKVACAF